MPSPPTLPDTNQESPTTYLLWPLSVHADYVDTTISRLTDVQCLYLMLYATCIILWSYSNFVSLYLDYLRMTGAWQQAQVSILLPRLECKGGTQAWVDKFRGVSNRDVLENNVNPQQSNQRTFPSSTNIDARILSGSPILPSAGTLCSSKFRQVKQIRIRGKIQHTVNMHPTIW